MVTRRSLLLAAGCWLIAVTLVSAQNMKVELNRWDFEWMKNSFGTDRLQPNPGENFGWGTASYPDEEGIPYAGQRCFRAAGINTGFGAVVLADPATEPNTLYQVEWMVKNAGPLPTGRAQIEFGSGQEGVDFMHRATGYVVYNWPKDTWVKDSLSWTSPASFRTDLNAVLIYIATVCNQGNPAGLTTGFYFYVDDVVLYKIVPKASAPPKIELFTREADGQPKDATVDAGETAMFNVLATGLAPLSYQWKKDGQPVSGATSRTLRIPNAGGNDAGTYTCTITNDDGSVTSNEVTLTVSGGVGVSNRLARGANTGFRVAINGSTAQVSLPASGAWTMELRTLDGKLVRKTAGTGAKASIAMPGGNMTYIARIVYNGQSFTAKIVGCE